MLTKTYTCMYMLILKFSNKKNNIAPKTHIESIYTTVKFKIYYTYICLFFNYIKCNIGTQNFIYYLYLKSQSELNFQINISDFKTQAYIFRLYIVKSDRVSILKTNIAHSAFFLNSFPY